MAYSDFSLERVVREFALRVNDREDFSGAIAPAAPGGALAAHLEQYVPLAVRIGTEKARSELIVVPMLLEVHRRMGGAIGFFSGVEFNVDRARGLNGVCDFLLSRSPLQVLITAPVMAVVEAKKDDIQAGLGQCVSEMVAARIFNERAGEASSPIHGAVTTGTLWQFLRLVGDSLAVDLREYPIDPAAKVLGILLNFVGGRP